MKPYFPTITLLRGIAALMVCFYHFTNYEDIHGALLNEHDFLRQLGQFGIQGVFIFFVISGFVIPLSLANESFRLPDFHRYIYRRFVRIEIPYLTSILIYLIIGFLFSIYNQYSYHLEGERMLHHLLYTIPFTEYNWYNPIYWTLAIEFQFYLVIALIYPLLVHRQLYLRRTALFLFPLLALLIPDKRLIFEYTPLFASGIFLFLLKTQVEKNWLALMGIILSLAVTFYVHGPLVAFSVSASILIIQFIHSDGKTGNGLGKLSYSLYLTHGAIGGSFLYLTVRYLDSYSIKIIFIVIALVISLIFSYLFWRYVEDPSRRISKKIKIKS